MAIEIQETHELVRVIENFPAVPSYWLDLCFPNVHFSDSEYIDFDIVDKGRRLAPFVAPNVQGQPMLQRRENIRKFKPAYIKPKDAVDPMRLIKRRAGESIGGSMSMQEREDAIVADILQDHRDMINRRLEWMACEAIKNGQVTVQGENYPTRTVGFGRAAGNTVTLTGTARWNDSAPTIYANIKAWTALVFKSGRRATRITLGTNASEDFFADADIKAMLDTRRGSDAKLESYNFNGGDVAIFHGTLPGGIEVWTYNDIYEDNDGFEQQFLSPNDVVITGDVEGVRAFGAILDRKASYAPMSMFPKMWESDDPSGLFLMTQSAPLMIPGRPNASFKATVR